MTSFTRWFKQRRLQNQARRQSQKRRRPPRHDLPAVRVEPLESRVLLTVFGGDLFYTTFTNHLEETVEESVANFDMTGRPAPLAFDGVDNVRRITYSYDDATNQITVSNDTAIAQLNGADGIVLTPDQQDVIVGGAINGEIHKVPVAGGGIQTAVIPGNESLHVTLDPSGQKVWTTQQPGSLLTEVSVNFGTVINSQAITGDDTEITQIAFGNGRTYYTSSDRDGGDATDNDGFFGILDLSTGVTTRIDLGGGIGDNLPYAHSIVFDPFTGDLILFGRRHIAQIDISNPDAPSLKATLDLSGILNNLTGLDGSATLLANGTIFGNPINNFDTGIELNVFDQGVTDGQGHALVAVNTGHLLLLDYKATGLVTGGVVATDPAPSDGNGLGISFVEQDLDDVAPIIDLATISGTKYSDDDGDGTQDGGELGLQGFTIYLDGDNDGVLDTSEPRVVTDANGDYAFTGLVPDTYRVREVQQAGFTQTEPGSGFYDITIAAGETSADNDFGNQPLPMGTNQITGFAWMDARENDMQDNVGTPAGEHGIRGVTVELFKTSDTVNPFLTTTTNSDGEYSFDNLEDDTYFVEFTPPNNRYDLVQQDVGSDAVDSDANTSTRRSPNVVLNNGNPSADFDAGYTANGIVIHFNFDFDTSGFFDPEPRRDLIQSAGDAVATHLQDDDYAGIDAENFSGQFPNNTWDARFDNPSTGNLETITDLLVATNEIIFYAGAVAGLGSLGTGGPGGNSASGGQDFFDLLNGRGQAGAVDTPATDFGNWGGQIRFDASANWFFGEDTNGLGPGLNDFWSVAVHEVVHAFGFGFGTSDSFTALITPQPPTPGPYFFTGDSARNELGLGPGENVSMPDASHFAPGQMSETIGGTPQEAVLDPDLLQGTRKELTRLDLAVLNDIGWEVDIFQPAQQPGSIGDFVFDDTDGDGIQDGGETGLAGVDVQLRDANTDALLDTDTTDANGAYLFDNLTPGDYLISIDQATLPAGATISPADQGGNDATDSDLLGTNRTATITVDEAEDDDTVDIGVTPAPQVDFDFGDADDTLGYNVTLADDGPRHILGSGLHLGDGVDIDADGQPSVDGLGDDNDAAPDDEDGINFQTDILRGRRASVGLDSSASGLIQMWVDFNQDGVFNDVSSTMPGGERVFTNFAINPGGSGTGFDVPETALLGNTFARIRISTQADLGPDGEAPDGEVEDYRILIEEGLGTGSIGDFIFNDLDADGIQDPGEPGIEGVTVSVREDGGSIIFGTTTTDVNGNYLFENLPPRDYRILVTTPAGAIDKSPANVGGDDTVDSDSDGNFGSFPTIAPIPLAAGQVDLTQDVGFIFNNVLPEVTVIASDDSTTEETDTGEFLFTRTGSTVGELTIDFTESGDATPGLDYAVLGDSIVIPDGQSSATLTVTSFFDNVFDPDEQVIVTIDPDAAYTVGAPDSATVTIVNTTPPATFTGKIFNELVNPNGGIEFGEPGLPGVDIILRQDTEQNGSFETLIDQQVTDANGDYTFTDLTFGLYQLEVPTAQTALAGLEPTFFNTREANIGAGQTTTFNFGFTDGIPEIQITEDDAEAAEPNDTGRFRIFSDIAVDEDTTVNFTRSGDATAGVDYQDFPLSVTILQGQTEAFIDVIPIDDGLFEGDELVTLTLQADPSFDLGPGTVGHVTIRENDSADQSSIAGTKFNDLNRNGVRDPGEPGVGGVTVFFDNNNNLMLDGGETSTVTDANGNYLFDNLLPGVYMVAEDLPANTIQTTPHYNSLLTPDQEVPPTSSDGNGFGFLALNEATNELVFEVNFTGLTGSTTMLHIHQGAAGVDGPVLFDLEAIAGVSDGFGSPVSGVIDIANDAQLALSVQDIIDDLNAGSLYFNLHTSTEPGGEIRGQIANVASHRVQLNPNQDVVGRDFGNFTLTPEITVTIGAAPVETGVGEVAFGDVLAGAEPGELPGVTFTIANDGEAPLDLDTPSLPAGFFFDAGTPFPVVINPSQSADVTVRLDSDSVGVKDGSFTFNNNDADESPFAINLTGEVTDLIANFDFDGGTIDPFVGLTGTVENINGALGLTESSDAAASTLISLPDSAADLTFDFAFTQTGNAGDRLSVVITGDNAVPVEVASFDGPDFTPGVFNDGGLVNVRDFAGQQITLEFRLVTADPVNAQVLIDNVVITSEMFDVVPPDTRGRIVYTDSDNNVVTLSYRGDGGFQLLRPAGTGGDLTIPADASNFVVTGSTAKSSLTVSVKGPTGFTHVDDIEVTGAINQIKADKVHLLGDLTTTGPAKQVRLADVDTDHNIFIGDDGAGDRDSVTFTFGVVTDLVLVSLIPIKSLTAIEWIDTNDATVPDRIETPSLGKLNIKGNKRTGELGRFEADLLLGQTPDPNARQTLGNTTIAGPVDNVTANIVGDVGNLTFRSTVSNTDFTVASKVNKYAATGAMTNVNLFFDEIGIFQSGAWDGGSFNAEFGRNFDVRADRRSDTPGDLRNVDVTFRNTPGQTEDRVIGNFKIADTIENVSLNATGDVNSVRGGDTFDFDIDALDVGNVQLASVHTGEWNVDSIKQVQARSNRNAADPSMTGQLNDLTISALGSVDPRVRDAIGQLKTDNGSTNLAVEAFGSGGNVDLRGAITGLALEFLGALKQLKLGDVADGSVTADSTGNVTAARWLTGEAIFEDVRNFKIAGDRREGTPGDSGVNVTVNQDDLSVARSAAGNISVADNLTGTWRVRGDTGNVSAGSVDAGFDGRFVGEVRGLTSKTFFDGFAAAFAFGKVDVKTTMTAATIIAGGAAGSALPNDIGTFKVGGAVTGGTRVLVGVDPVVDDFAFDDGDDLFKGDPDNLIKSITIGPAPTNTDVMFQAVTFPKSVKIDGDSIDPLADTEGRFTVT